MLLGGVGGALFAMHEEPQPSPGGIQKLQAIYKERFDKEITTDEAYHVLQGLMKIIWEAQRAGVYVDGPDSADEPEAPSAPAPKARVPRWDRELPPRKKRKIGYDRYTKDWIGSSTRPKLPKPSPGEIDIPSPS